MLIDRNPLFERKPMRTILSTTLLGVALAACVMSPDPVINEPATSETTQHDESCYSYCNYGDFYCPSNPLMECYFYCYQTCVVCSDETYCFDNPPPQG